MIREVRNHTFLNKGIPLRVILFRRLTGDPLGYNNYFKRVNQDGGTLEAGSCVINFLKYLD